MMKINANTKIGAIIKQNPDALEAIVSISPKFEKLRNPVLRKLIAGRASIAMASKIGSCSVNDFFIKLEPLGFDIDRETIIEKETASPVPGFIQNINPELLVDLDVRGVINSGKDPLKLILDKVKDIQVGQVLKIINSFEPTPLMLLLGKQGFESFSETIEDDLVYTYFYKKSNITPGDNLIKTEVSGDWDEIMTRFEGRLQKIDVRELEMPKPMMTILEAMENLPEDMALFVFHKRIPVFLLPELVDRKLEYRAKEISESEVHMLIFKA